MEDLTRGSDHLRLSDAGVQISFRRDANRLMLLRIERPAETPFVDDGEVGNPFAAVVPQGRFAGVHSMSAFHVNRLYVGARRLLAFLEHDLMPMQVSLDISVEGNVITWLGQVLWNGDEQFEVDIYFPLLSRVRFDGPKGDRAIFPQISGSVRGPLGSLNYSGAYLGNLSSPAFIVEGGGRGLAVIDDNRADLAADPGASARRVYFVGNAFPLPDSLMIGGEQGPFIGIRHTRVFRPVSRFGGEAGHGRAEAQDPPYMKKLGDGVDLGPVRTYAYTGDWKTGALWLRGQRTHVPMRISSAPWYRKSTFIAESGLDQLAREGQTFLDLPRILEDSRSGGADLLLLYGYHDGELLGVEANMQNRGDYIFAAQNLGGPDGLRKGMEATHRAGGHVLLYVEGMIMWRRSRVGRSRGQDWAMRDADGTPTEHYRGFWHACPACSGYQDWLACTLAEILRKTRVDGFFIDSLLATHNHRCFNSDHNHPHPDVWNWGVRQLLRRVREEVDRVNPEAVLLVEGCGDVGREFVDGFIAHSHRWTGETCTEPFLRFLHPDIRTFESWGTSNVTASRNHVWNSVNGHRIFAHAHLFRRMASLSRRTRKYYDAFPEITGAPISSRDVKCRNCIARLYEGGVVAIGNTTAGKADAEITLPLRAAILLDRVDGSRVQAAGGKFSLPLRSYEFRAFEIRP